MAIISHAKCVHCHRWIPRSELNEDPCPKCGKGPAYLVRSGLNALSLTRGIQRHGSSASMVDHISFREPDSKYTFSWPVEDVIAAAEALKGENPWELEFKRDDSVYTQLAEIEP